MEDVKGKKTEKAKGNVIYSRCKLVVGRRKMGQTWTTGSNTRDVLANMKVGS
jgi:hypothetical protein